MKNIDMKSKCDALLMVIEDNCRKARLTCQQINRLKAENSVRTEETSCKFDSPASAVEKEKFEDDNRFEDEIAFYLESYLALEDHFTKDDLLDILPSRKHFEYQNILLRLKAESIRELKEIHELMLEDSENSKEDLEEYRKLLFKEQKKISFLDEILNQKDEKDVQQESSNEIILVPTTYGNIRIIDEMEHIPSEFYPGFLELIQSIIDGTFKNVKRFTNNNQLSGVYEVKGYQVRVVFSRLKRDTYAIITGFVKKTTNDKFYQDQLKNKVADYRSMADELKRNCDNEEFLRENSLAVQELFQILDGKDSVKKAVKGDDYHD